MRTNVPSSTIQSGVGRRRHVRRRSRRGAAAPAAAGSGHCSQAISWPRGAHGVLLFSAKLTLRKYSTPGSAVIAGSPSATVFCWRGARSSSGTGPEAITRPLARMSHRPSTRSFGLISSNQLFTVMVPAARSTGAAWRYR